MVRRERSALRHQPAPVLKLEAEPSHDAVAEAAFGRISAWREETRQTRMKIAFEAERRFGRKISWGAGVGEQEGLFTQIAAPAMTRLRQPQRQVLDTLVEAGVARSRSDALAWCVKLVDSTVRNGSPSFAPPWRVSARCGNRGQVSTRFDPAVASR